MHSLRWLLLSCTLSSPSFVFAQITYETEVVDVKQGGHILAREIVQADSFLFAGRTVDTSGDWRAAVWNWTEQDDPGEPVPITLLPDSSNGDSAAMAADARQVSLVGINFAGTTTTLGGEVVPCVWRSNDGTTFAQTPLPVLQEGTAVAIGGPTDQLLGTLVGGSVTDGLDEHAAVWELVALPNAWERTDLPCPIAGPCGLTAVADGRLGGWVTVPGGAQRAAIWERDGDDRWQYSVLPLTPPAGSDRSHVGVIHACNAQYESMVIWRSTMIAGEFGVLVTNRAGVQWSFPVTGVDGVQADRVSWVTNSCHGDFGVQIVGSVENSQNVIVPARVRPSKFPVLELEPIVASARLPDFESSWAVGATTLDTGTIVIPCSAKTTNDEERGFLLILTPRSADLDNDTDTDLRDLAIFLQQYTGP